MILQDRGFHHVWMTWREKVVCTLASICKTGANNNPCKSSIVLFPPYVLWHLLCNMTLVFWKKLSWVYQSFLDIELIIMPYVLHKVYELLNIFELPYNYFPISGSWLMIVSLERCLEAMLLKDIYWYGSFWFSFPFFLPTITRIDKCFICVFSLQMLYVHIPSRHPPSFPELELPTHVQVKNLKMKDL